MKSKVNKKEVWRKIQASFSLSTCYSFNWFFISVSQSFTGTPVNTADSIVPSLVPTSFPPKKIKESTIENATHDTSKAIFTFENSLCITSESAFTNASPEFKITFAITPRVIPKPRINSAYNKR